MPTVKVTFVQATYVLATYVPATCVLATYVLETFAHFSNISAVTDPILPKKMLAQIFFQNKSFFDKIFFQTQNFFGPLSKLNTFDLSLVVYLKDSIDLQTIY